jgi:hypothetical protein
VTDPELPDDVRDLLVKWATGASHGGYASQSWGLRELGPLRKGQVVRPHSVVTPRFLATAGGGTAAVLGLILALDLGPVVFLVLLLVSLLVGAGVFLADMSRRFNEEQVASP